MGNLTGIITKIIADFSAINAGAAQVGQAILIFFSTTGPSGLKVATDIMTDIATKTVTPDQAISQLQDISAFSTAVNAAIATIKAEPAAQ
jgi:hypothetical protein